jgi:osmotically inducible protein OsmC
LSFRVIRAAQATWQGTVSDGGGHIAVSSGALDGPYSFRARVDDVEQVTNPEELIAAAEAGCFTMSLADRLTEAGHPPRELRTMARARLEQVGQQFNVTRIDLSAVADVPGIDAAEFARLAEQAKDCTITRALAGTEITLEASLAAQSLAGG